MKKDLEYFSNFMKNLINLFFIGIFCDYLVTEGNNFECLASIQTKKSEKLGTGFGDGNNSIADSIGHILLIMPHATVIYERNI